jgi:hypothetical protein
VAFELDGSRNSLTEPHLSGHSIPISEAEVQATLETPRTSEKGGEVDQEAVDPPPLVCGSTVSGESSASSAAAAAAASSTAAPHSPDSSLAHPNGGKPAQSSWANARPLLFGIFMGQIGMVLFNLGLTYGFTAIG